MKTKALLTATILLFATGLATSVVGGPNASDGEYAITSTGSSASSTTSVGPNGTEYSTHFSVTGSNYNNQTGVINSSQDNMTYRFNGSIETNDACFNVKHSVNETGENQYTFDIVSQEEDGACIQPITYHSYQASFQAEQPYKLTITHDGETVDTFTHPDYTENSGNNNNNQDGDTGGVRGPIASFLNFLSGLFR
ncbi:hypothetical protein [Candidatus Nanohalovita haloferacivicina]|uniref:hypothetical protein n=1 Tax=Candidatus Nanohalovita haloferacivicina TaxID=2978046 RepID=UPI00325FCE81|nr:hypothetical protein HBNXNv_0575 [Candidatus Nanohalobia archaeon BNXNv]